MNEAVIGLGTNQGDRMENLQAAVDAIKLLPATKIEKISKVYQTKPVGYENQEDFLNADIKIKTALSPHALLGACLGIEASMGRVRTIKNGPRIIDLDVLLYDGFKLDTFELKLPHPRAMERAFVMVPLLDLYPEGRAPTLYFGLKLKSMDTDGVQLYDEELKIK
ncbi:MAG: 2-amino-4-hydroxy-6-hydroxymethyldihydropteridine diphosphokinase [Clostridiales bacterium]|nr:2-amino-4-hydroxy-6-hydroxymethyldihydropteridine diphosphokinase [Clostridiales bacterium]